MTTATPSKSAAVRAKLNHPVLDSDGHTVEFEPALHDYLKQVGGANILERYLSRRSGGGWYRRSPDDLFEKNLCLYRVKSRFTL